MPQLRLPSIQPRFYETLVQVAVFLHDKLGDERVPPLQLPGEGVVLAAEEVRKNANRGLWFL